MNLRVVSCLKHLDFCICLYTVQAKYVQYAHKPLHTAYMQSPHVYTVEHVRGVSYLKALL